ncbi:cytochrome c peroxidase [Owenweeksia hongkongensis DSM 17368]|uniref:Cytochrome c peroxidase n=1 Tax=Owenweeksia hongkongensis (strain DSM 17368 / CIP 108786 / JCM 12287 / NRRL B-23963 / UST20020801) TaxID=926562 RepID=G8R5T0_OWEHD|nr:cytochrome c peroxidase [Owenweeksia hongkongensis]AEV34396.1 cytochrome c peroxidase [Owenweeksia hongkongensis DSM 17368]
MRKINKSKRIQNPAFGISVLIILALLTLIISCKNDKPEPEGLTPYSISIPKGFPKMEIPDNNQPYEERVALGRRLYYDPILSNNGLSCSSCHWQKKGFTIPTTQGMPVLPHVNMAWKDIYMWDGREQGNLEDVMLFEVEEFFGTDISKLNKHPEYPELFAEAYNSNTITSHDVAKALAQFFRILISADSKYDRVMAGTESFSDKELKGYRIFSSEKSSCYHCHMPPLFTDSQLHNNGVDSTFENPENWGYFSTSRDSGQLSHMRTPTLRNLSLRNRFMHDGRYASIEEVVDFYNKGVNHSPSLDPVMVKSNGELRLGLTPEETEQLVAFLKTLTDSTFITNKSLSNPN